MTGDVLISWIAILHDYKYSISTLKRPVKSTYWLQSMVFSFSINGFPRSDPGPFRLPSLVGTYVMKQKLRTEVLTSFRNLECIAQTRTIDLARVIGLEDDTDRHVQHCRS
jgi:hypothetical protein